ncbi:MAG: hypothetical protein ABH883_09445 [Candidatus Omnitrophota bacterium]
MWSLGKKSQFRESADKLLRLSVLILFALNSLTENTFSQDFSPFSQLTAKNLSIDQFELPESLGEVKFRYSGTGGKTVIHIQDAHCNYDSQKAMLKILDDIEKNFGIKVLFLEGGTGKYDLSVFTGIENKDIRKEVTDYFLKAGRIGAGEAFAINNRDRVELVGLEDQGLYLDNLKVYRDSLDYKNTVNEIMDSIKGMLKALKPRIYSPELIEFDKNYFAYKVHDMEFKDYILFLTARLDTSEENQMSQYPNISGLLRTIGMEEKLDFKKANKERDDLIKNLEKNVSRVRLSGLVEKTIEFRLKRINSLLFYKYILSLAEEVKMNVSAYSSFLKYTEYLEMYDNVNKGEVSGEIKSLEEKVQDMLFRDDAQRELAVRVKHASMLKDLFEINLVPDDYSYCREHADEFTAAWFLDFIRSEAARLKIPVRLTDNIYDLDVYADEMMKFFELGYKRDEAFVRNIKGSHADKEIEWENAVIITGGFHTENLCRLLKDEEISYVSITPQFVNPEGYESPYKRLLAGGRSPFESLIRKSIDIFAIQVASMLNRLGLEVSGLAGKNDFDLAVRARAAIDNYGRFSVLLGQTNRRLVIAEDKNMLSENGLIGGKITRIEEGGREYFAGMYPGNGGPALLEGEAAPAVILNMEDMSYEAHEVYVDSEIAKAWNENRVKAADAASLLEALRGAGVLGKGMEPELIRLLEDRGVKVYEINDREGDLLFDGHASHRGIYIVRREGSDILDMAGTFMHELGAYCRLSHSDNEDLSGYIEYKTGEKNKAGIPVELRKRMTPALQKTVTDKILGEIITGNLKNGIVLSAEGDVFAGRDYTKPSVPAESFFGIVAAEGYLARLVNITAQIPEYDGLLARLKNLLKKMGFSLKEDKILSVDFTDSDIAAALEERDRIQEDPGYADINPLIFGMAKVLLAKKLDTGLDNISDYQVKLVAEDITPRYSRRLDSTLAVLDMQKITRALEERTDTVAVRLKVFNKGEKTDWDKLVEKWNMIEAWQGEQQAEIAFLDDFLFNRAGFLEKINIFFGRQTQRVTSVRDTEYNMITDIGLEKGREYRKLARYLLDLTPGNTNTATFDHQMIIYALVSKCAMLGIVDENAVLSILRDIVPDVERADFSKRKNWMNIAAKLNEIENTPIAIPVKTPEQKFIKGPPVSWDEIVAYNRENEQQEEGYTPFDLSMLESSAGSPEVTENVELQEAGIMGGIMNAGADASDSAVYARRFTELMNSADAGENVFDIQAGPAIMESGGDAVEISEDIVRPSDLTVVDINPEYIESIRAIIQNSISTAEESTAGIEGASTFVLDLSSAKTLIESAADSGSVNDAFENLEDARTIIENLETAPTFIGDPAQDDLLMDNLDSLKTLITKMESEVSPSAPTVEIAGVLSVPSASEGEEIMPERVKWAIAMAIDNMDTGLLRGGLKTVEDRVDMYAAKRGITDEALKTSLNDKYTEEFYRVAVEKAIGRRNGEWNVPVTEEERQSEAARLNLIFDMIFQRNSFEINGLCRQALLTAGRERNDLVPLFMSWLSRDFKITRMEKEIIRKIETAITNEDIELMDAVLNASDGSVFSVIDVFRMLIDRVTARHDPSSLGSDMRPFMQLIFDRIDNAEQDGKLDAAEFDSLIEHAKNSKELNRKNANIVDVLPVPKIVELDEFEDPGYVGERIDRALEREALLSALSDLNVLFREIMSRQGDIYSAYESLLTRMVVSEEINSKNEVILTSVLYSAQKSLDPGVVIKLARSLNEKAVRSGRAAYIAAINIVIAESFDKMTSASSVRLSGSEADEFARESVEGLPDELVENLKGANSALPAFILEPGKAVNVIASKDRSLILNISRTEDGAYEGKIIPRGRTRRIYRNMTEASVFTLKQGQGGAESVVLGEDGMLELTPVKRNKDNEIAGEGRNHLFLQVLDDGAISIQAIDESKSTYVVSAKFRDLLNSRQSPGAVDSVSGKKVIAGEASSRTRRELKEIFKKGSASAAKETAAMNEKYARLKNSIDKGLRALISVNNSSDILDGIIAEEPDAANRDAYRALAEILSGLKSTGNIRIAVSDENNKLDNDGKSIAAQAYIEDGTLDVILNGQNEKYIAALVETSDSADKAFAELLRHEFVESYIYENYPQYKDAAHRFISALEAREDAKTGAATALNVLMMRNFMDDAQLLLNIKDPVHANDPDGRLFIARCQELAARGIALPGIKIETLKTLDDFINYEGVNAAHARLVLERADRLNDFTLIGIAVNYQLQNAASKAGREVKSVLKDKYSEEIRTALDVQEYNPADPESLKELEKKIAEDPRMRDNNSRAVLFSPENFDSSALTNLLGEKFLDIKTNASDETYMSPVGFLAFGIGLASYSKMEPGDYKDAYKRILINMANSLKTGASPEVTEENFDSLIKDRKFILILPKLEEIDFEQLSNCFKAIRAAARSL